jgi:hypothetical protein
VREESEKGVVIRNSLYGGGERASLFYRFYRFLPLVLLVGVI